MKKRTLSRFLPIRSVKIILFAVGGFVGLLVFVAVALLLFVHVIVTKPRLEAAASAALGMEFEVGGRLGVRFLPALSVTLQDMHIRNRGTEVATAKETRLEIEVLPLLHKEVRIRNIALKRPRISIERDRDGKFNFERTEKERQTFLTLDIAKVALSDATLLYADKRSREGFEAGDCQLAARRLRLSGGKNWELLRKLSFTGEVACSEIRTKGFAVSGLKLSVAGKDGVFDLKPVVMGVFGGQGSGSIQADFSGAVPVYHVRYSLLHFRIDEFLKTLSPNKVAKGSINFVANLSMQGKTANEMKRTMDGEISLRGENLTLDGNDLDRQLSRFESSQNFNLVDVGAFFFAGPLGLAVTKGYNFAGILQGSGGRSEIRTLVSDWKVTRGMAQARDVAMATNENRVALQGRLDFVNEMFDDVTVAIIDAKGCTKVRQKIRGPFQEPVVEKPSILKSLVGPALNLLKKARAIFPGKPCEVFYAGSVAPPK